ncbi:MAG: glycosyltransferase [Candidatus Methylacidiphilales bacterium]|nr:glycosyltransferase [Candidatus Methylacidiphilales bacterium]
MKLSVDLTVILPAYEEAENLRSLLPSLREAVEALVPQYEILVVDAISPRDETPAICASEGVRYVARQGGENYGHAIRTGIAASSGRHVVIMDADGSHNPVFLRSMWEKRDEADLVIASRYINGGKTENPAVLIFMSLIVNVVFRLVLRLNCLDVSNSLRLYRGDDLRSLELRCDHFDIVEEILVLLCCRTRGYRVCEVPVTFEVRKAGKTKRQLLAFAFSYVVVLCRLWALRRRTLRNIGVL